MANEPITREEMLLNAVATGEAASFDPITREEMFLAKLGGADVTTPTPITRKEQFLQKAIENAGSGGSGGGAGGIGSADERVKYVTFMYGATELYKQPVISGDTCRDPVTSGYIDAPTMESTAQYDYTQNGWSLTDGGAADSNALVNVTEDRVVYAAFNATTRMYTITWLDEDGTKLPGQKQWAYGTVPSYTPTKEGVAFDKWIPTPVAVTGDASYTASWVSTIASGTCGQNTTWTLYASGELRISGSGETYNYGTGSTPWYSNRSLITSIVIENGVTSIGDGLFYYHTGLTKVVIPDHVTGRIGRYTFSNCSALTSLTIGAGITSLDYCCLQDCSKLKEVTIPNSVTSIGELVFNNCSSLAQITLGNNITSIGKKAFNKCSALVSITLPDSLQEIPYGLFYECTKLANVNLGNGITSIGEYAFYKTSALRSLTIPASVKHIATRTFQSSGITSITFESQNGWYVTQTVGATSGDAIDVSNPATNATYLKSTYSGYHWYRT